MLRQVSIEDKISDIFGSYTSRMLALCILLTLCSCSAKPQTLSYQTMYAHLNKGACKAVECTTSDYFLVVIVNARHLDYTDNHSFFKTVAKHPSDGCKNGDVGHTWIYLQGIRDGEPVYLEGGFSGEYGYVQARYFDGIMNYLDYGYANPAPEQMACPRYEPNPVKYLWEIQHDGFFEWGGGCHRPTYAAKVNLTPEQFNKIFSFIDNYQFHEYSIIDKQCSSFAAQVASIGGLKLDTKVTISIKPVLYVGGQPLRFWTDPCFSELTVSSPDIIERSLMQAVEEGRAEYALDWYLQTHPEPWKSKAKRLHRNVTRFPKRFCRYLMIQ